MRTADSTDALVRRAQAGYAGQDMRLACSAIDAAAKQAPGDPLIAFMQAQFAYEGWHEAVPKFERAALLNPGNRDVVRNFAMALASEGQGERAENLLDAILLRTPGWIDGHNTLATQRTTAGQDDPLRSFAEAVQHEPRNVALYQAWFHKLAAAKDWEAAARVLHAGELQMPEAMLLLRLYLDCESGTANADPAIFAPYAQSCDAGLALLQLRHALRHGDVERASSLAQAQLGTPNESQFWPYCSLAWRLLGDPSALWLEGDPGFAATIDLDIEETEISDLAVFLRSLHRMNAPYPEQSVRNGRQTDRNLLLHHDQCIMALRERLTAEVIAWRDNLPESDTHHPLLSRKPESICYTGSWSVQLAEGGHHSAHTHPKGWASSAFYVALPRHMGNDHGGELALGIPPPELGLSLQPETYIQPKTGRLVLFPSTSWHGTVPFAGEERLTLAFDIAPGSVAKESFG